jgi:hypothetical protein
MRSPESGLPQNILPSLGMENVMSNANPPPNVKIYDRPEPKTPKAIFLVIAVIVLLAIGLLIYKFVLHPAAPAAGAHAAQNGRAIGIRSFQNASYFGRCVYDNCGIERHFERV